MFRDPQGLGGVVLCQKQIAFRPKHAPFRSRMMTGFLERNRIEKRARLNMLIVQQVGDCQFRRRIPDHPGGAKFLCHGETRLQILDGKVCLKHQQVVEPERIIHARDALRILDLRCDSKHGIGMGKRIRKQPTLRQTECNVPLSKRLA